MSDLRITFDNKNGEKVSLEYETFFDFVEKMDNKDIDIPMQDLKNVHAEFYGSDLIVKDFKDVTELCDFVDSLVKDYTKERDEIEEL